jgi:hypothetical protein
MEYNGTYIYPPYPDKKISFKSLHLFENGKYLGQPKLNGSSMEIYMNEKQIFTMNRHKKSIRHKMDIKELRGLYRGKGWIVICGEYMNKNQRDEENKKWNIKFVIFDILVYNGKHLLKSTFDERFDFLKELYPDKPVKKHLHQISENCFRVNAVRFGFTNIFKDITRHQMYEGFVLKEGSGKLEPGTRENNNCNTQIKCRKSTKNYAF